MKPTMTKLLLFCALIISFTVPPQDDSLLVVSWNVENFLNPKTDTTGRYTRSRFRTKCNAIAKTILLIADSYGRVPDAVALMEVGDRYVLERLVRDTPLRKLDYDIVHYDSPDRRGIDCALLYRRSSLQLLRSAPIHLYDSTGAIMRTRDILLAEFDGLAVLVNHHPSKVGSDSQRRRSLAMARMTALIDSLSTNQYLNMDSGCLRQPVLEAEGRQKGDLACEVRGNPFPRPLGVQGDSSCLRQPVLAVGDFNDDVWPHDGPRSATEGTIKYNGAWEKIDGFFARGSITVQETIFNHPILSEPDRSFGGTKPRRAFSGPRWLGGISDHYPVVLLISGH